jgi:hypothetical protein
VRQQMRFGIGIVALLLIGCVVSACTNSTIASTAKQTTASTPSSITTIAPSTTAVPETTAAPEGTLGNIGPHPFTITGVSVSSVNWLTVDLHPSTLPIQLQATSSAALQVCPANLDGSISGSGSWPSGFNFGSCFPFDGVGSATLPPSDGSYHLAFAVRPIAAGISASISLTVNYSATDTFVAVLPPTTVGNTEMTATFIPESTTIGDNIAPLGLADTVPAPGYAALAAQGGRPLSSPAGCDFPTELDSCIGGVTPNQIVEIHVHGPGTSKVTVSLAWK